MEFIGMTRVKNEARWIDRCIRSLLPLCRKVYVLDDHSDDATPEIANSFSESVVFDSPFDTFAETRDKTWLLRQIAENEPDTDFIICIDGDEELEPAGTHKITSLLKRGRIDAAAVRIPYMWNSERQWRTDGIYRNFHRPSIFRLDRRFLEYRSVYGNNTTLHCTNTPYGLIGATTPTDIHFLHWGYFDRETRIRKYHWYNEIDPKNETEDQYRHMVIGDLFPADSQFRYAGPLKLEPLSL